MVHSRANSVSQYRFELPLIGRAAAAMLVDDFIALYKRSRGSGRRK
jgi:hypothetical protein